MAVFEGKKSSNAIVINDIMSDDEVVASDVPPRYLFPNVAIRNLLRKEICSDKRSTARSRIRVQDLVSDVRNLGARTEKECDLRVNLLFCLGIFMMRAAAVDFCFGISMTCV